MNIETILKQREKQTDDQINISTSLFTTDRFTGLIEKSVTSNKEITSLFVVKYEFENLTTNEIVENIKQHVLIGENYIVREVDPYLAIHYDQKEKNCN